MKRRRKKRPLILILIFFIIISFSILILNYQFKKIIFEPSELSFLNSYFKKKTIFAIINGSKKIMIDYPEIIKIEFYPNLWQAILKIKFRLSQIIAEICDYQNNCFFLDNYARVTDKRKVKEDYTSFLKIISELPLEKDSLLNPKIKDVLTIIFEYANWKTLFLKEIKIYSNFDLAIVDEKNRQFLIDPHKDIEEQIKKLHLFISKDFKGSRIDLRIPKKIYYR